MNTDWWIHLIVTEIVVGFIMKEHRSWDRRGFGEIGIHYYYNYIIKRQQHAEVVFDDYDVRKSQEKYVVCIIYVSLTDFPELPSVSASIFYHFEPDNDFSIEVYLPRRSHWARGE
jgi:hypothetical protein